ncbi:MauE/DoxX family redox-associated membrane protein [Flavobacterium yafengii]|uniref:MauE/DoxX family redox-associated membrane protein n=1 Tax=Flavobacterium yafengii TaxID=3041253 RepID=UPI0024A86630|nr:MauE/DoxX family redox-associated membrane protein [Flavobacterium yafengii]MDI5887400.1 MauE/DoxX family redox-associated membrane protein [Flavobacterium yafengii]
MSKIQNFKSNFILIISFLTALLFMYAASSKLIDFENFRIQLGQSPLLSAFTAWVAILVPVTEILIAIVLFIPKFRFFGLLSAFALMMMFTVYIYIILNFSAYIPCSCGGILEKMTWNQHLVFNLIFVVILAVAIIFVPIDCKNRLIISTMNTKRKIWVLIITAAAGSAAVVILFLLSENIIQYHNNFTRRFPQHAAQERYKINLLYNSYYFAGIGNGKIYLGNRTAPLLITIFDLKTKTTTSHKIILKQTDLPFRVPKIRVFNQNFFVFEGAVPYVFKGSISNWIATLTINSGARFSQAEPIDSINLAVRYKSPQSGENLLGILNSSDSLAVRYAPDMLQKQIDGVFDTDGSLHFNTKLDKIVYVYRYRNQYSVTDRNLVLQYRGNTIDTISRAQLEIAEVGKSKVTKLAKRALVVNKSSAVSGNYLYVNSLLPGQYDAESVWKNASIIDIYDLTKKSYQSSFYVYHIKNKKMRSFIVIDNHLYALIKNHLVCYEFLDDLIPKN